MILLIPNNVFHLARTLLKVLYIHRSLFITVTLEFIHFPYADSVVYLLLSTPPCICLIIKKRKILQFLLKKSQYCINICFWFQGKKVDLCFEKRIPFHDQQRCWKLSLLQVFGEIKIYSI